MQAELLSSEITADGVPTVSDEPEGNIANGAMREPSVGLAESDGRASTAISRPCRRRPQVAITAASAGAPPR
ncbi:MAG: hypothetical protein ACREQM_08700, partial [Candidatus Dormibacteraceae bacterium]